MIILVDQSTDHPRAGTLSRIADAMSQQLQRDVAPAWDRHAVDVVVGEPGPTPAGIVPVVLFDDSDHATALGYHGRTPEGDAYARVFVRPVLRHGGDWTSTALSVSSVISHEVVETFLDPAVNLWMDDGDRTLYAVEIADPVEAVSYPVVAGRGPVMVSNFVLPGWFDRAAHGPVDHVGTLAGPLDLAPGGYAVLADEGPPRQVFGAHEPASWRSRTKDFPASRTWRRLHGIDWEAQPARATTYAAGGPR